MGSIPTWLTKQSKGLSSALVTSSQQYEESFPVERAHSQGLDVEVVEKDVVNWAQDTGALARKDLVAVNAHLFLNKSNISGAVPPKVVPKKDNTLAVLAGGYRNPRLPGFGEPGAKTKKVAAQPATPRVTCSAGRESTTGTCRSSRTSRSATANAACSFASRRTTS